MTEPPAKLIAVYAFRYDAQLVPDMHLKMIDPQTVSDPQKEMQEIGSDYLDNEDGMLLEKIPRGRHYFPAYDPDCNIAQLGDQKAAQGS